VSSLDSLDFAQSLSLLGAWVDGYVIRCLDDAGLDGLRPGHGYFVQRLLTGPATATEMARALGVSQQAASKAVGELVGLGYVALSTDNSDRRRKTASLTGRGREAVRRSRLARAALDRRLRGAIGEAPFATALDALHRAMEELDLATAVRTRTVRPSTEP
jgi:DNA-binding MarR family transcriptional regulator